MKRVTIVGEDVVARQIVKEVYGLGATGHTCTIVHGQGANGTRPNPWEGPNSKIEVIATPEVAQRILEHVAQNYFDHYAIIAYVDDLEVLRPEKFGLGPQLVARAN
jgi:hypothetical protein